MGHPFGDLLSRYLHRKHGLSQAGLALGILQDPSVITKMCKGQRLTGPQARDRVLAIIGWLHQQAAIETAADANALLASAAMASLRANEPGEAALLGRLRPEPIPTPVPVPTPGSADLLASATSRWTNLPAALTSFIGRTQELAEITRCIATGRLVTLTGAGGVGKTRLATEVGIRLVQGTDGSPFAHGVWLVELAELSRPALVADALVHTFKLSEQGGQTPLELLQAYLADKQLLLILDNCEHLVDACAEVVERLLHRCWQIRVLATSREELRIPGETLYPVLPLALPDLLEQDPEQVIAAAAAQLFVERIGAGHPMQQAVREDAATLAHICCQLDGMPLALELAAPLTRSMPLGTIAAQLDQQMALLTNTYRTAIPRHQTMHSALVWSHRLLAPAEQHLLARVSVFSGGWTQEAAQAVCGDIPSGDLLQTLQQLVAKSLVLEEHIDGQRRYRLLEPVRQFAHAQLAASGEPDLLRRRHATYFLALAEQMEQARDTSQELVWLQRLEPERANLRAVHSWAIEQGEAEFAHRFTGSLFSFWGYRSSTAEVRHLIEAVLQLKAPVPTRAALTAEALVLDFGGYIVQRQRDFALARTWFDHELAIYTALDDQRGIAKALRGCAGTAMLSGDLAQAQDLTERSLRVSRGVDDRGGVAWSLFQLGYMAMVRGAFDQARAWLEDAVSELREQGIVFGMLKALIALGHTMRSLGDDERAHALYHDALHIQQQMHYVQRISGGLEGLAGLAAGAGDAVRAARLFGAAHAHRGKIAAMRPRHMEAIYDRDVALARSLLDPDAWQAAWAAGVAMPLDQAVTDALAESAPGERGASADCHATG